MNEKRVKTACGQFRKLVARTSAATGLEFFRILTEELAQALGLKYALVSELTDARMERARTLAIYSGHGHLPNFEYDLVGTPCENVSQGKFCFYASDVQKSFPQDRHLVEMGIEGYLGVPLRNSAGEAVGIFAALHDKPIAESEDLLAVFDIFAARAGLELERLRIETMLHASERRFKSLLECGTDLILAVDRDGIIQYASPSSLRVSGYRPEEVIGKSAFDFIPVPDRAHLLSLMCRALERPEPGPLFETRLLRKDGVWIDVESRANQIYIEPHNVGLVVNCRDITDRRKAEQRLIHSQRIETIGEISAGIAHEFKNLLVPILGSVELASLDLAESDPAQKQLRQAVKSIRVARDLVQQILTFGRQAGNARAEANLGAVLSDALRMLRVAVPKTVEITHEIAADLPTVIVDAGQMNQVIMNLGINAWQAMEGRLGWISFKLDQVECVPPGSSGVSPSRFVRLSVTDNGKGMDTATRARLFEPFFTTKSPGEGTGLGLSVVHGIVRTHNGFIEAQSEVGKGTIFTILLPAIVRISETYDSERK